LVESLFLDWSGTIADDLAPVVKATNLVLAEHGRPGLSREEFRTTFRLPFVHFWNDALPGFPLEEIEEAYHKHFVELQDAVELLPGARDLLAACAQAGIRLFLLSSIKPIHFEKQSATLGVRDYFEHAHTGVYDKCAAFPGILAEMKTPAHTTMYVGDMVHDVEAGRAAGVRTIAVLSGYDPIDKLRAAGPDALLENIGFLAPLLELTPHRSPTPTVGCLIAHPNDADRFLLCRSAKWNSKWGMPGGKVRLGETVIEALHREIREETGLALTEPRHIFTSESINDPDYRPSRHFLILNYLAKASTFDVSLNNEAEEFKWVTLEEATGMLLNNPTRELIARIKNGDIHE
jgi:phosphoglycolate phosphatase-like HAD superfamily hydrolase/ADP-ribose pyrophosphatase YjhB (NUDIX family)